MTTQQIPILEDIEGLVDGDDSTWGEYPIDTLLIRNESRTVHDIVRRIDKGSFVMDPDFQRDFIWPEDKQSKLIESVLMRIPIPVFYLAEDEQGRLVVVDGLQRLSTFRDFVNGQLRLKLKEREDLHGKRFADLTPKLQNRVEDCNLILYVIDTKVPERARLDIFERVNGGVALTRQQMRNSLYMGPATRFLKNEAGTDLFLEATGGSLNTKTMRDREFVNRFCAFQLLPLDEYRDMDEFLARALKEMNRLPEAGLEKLSGEFRTALSNNYTLFGKHAFRKHTPDQTSRSPLNASLWDVMATGLSSVSSEWVQHNAAEFKAAFYRLLDEETFVASITYGPNHVRSVKCRFERTKTMLSEVDPFHFLCLDLEEEDEE